MNEAGRAYEWPGLVSTARVVTARDPSRPIVESERFGSLVARVAVVGDYRPEVGDRVLVTSDEHGNRYIVGVLRALRVEPAASPAGSRVHFEHLPEENRTVLRVPVGDLCIEAASGQVEVRGALGVTIKSEQDLELEAKGDLDLTSCAADGRALSGVHLHGDSAELRAGLLTAKAAHLHALAERVTLFARQADTRLERHRHRADVVEVQADKILETAKETYRTVEGLAQTQAGRIRLVAESTLHVLAERAKMRAKEVFAIDGDQIHLG